MTFPSLTSCLLLLAPAAPVAQDDPSTVAAQAKAVPVETGIAEDVEIMRRLLVRALSEASIPKVDPPQSAQGWSFHTTGIHNLSLQDWAVMNGHAYPNPATGAIDDSNGFHVPGTGVVFTVEGRVPVRQVVKSTNAFQPAEESSDPWAELEQEVRSGAEEAPALDTVLWEFQAIDPLAEFRLELDPDRISSLVDATLETLASFGARMDLGPEETVTVCLHLTPGEDPSLHYPWFTDVDGDMVNDLWITNTLMHFGTQAPEDLEQRVVVQLPRQALVDLAARKGGVAEAKARAMVHTY